MVEIAAFHSFVYSASIAFGQWCISCFTVVWFMNRFLLSTWPVLQSDAWLAQAQEMPFIKECNFDLFRAFSLRRWQTSANGAQKQRVLVLGSVQPGHGRQSSNKQARVPMKGNPERSCVWPRRRQSLAFRKCKSPVLHTFQRAGLPWGPLVRGLLPAKF